MFCFGRNRIVIAIGHSVMPVMSVMCAMSVMMIAGHKLSFSANWLLFSSAPIQRIVDVASCKLWKVMKVMACDISPVEMFYIFLLPPKKLFKAFQRIVFNLPTKFLRSSSSSFSFSSERAMACLNSSSSLYSSSSPTRQFATSSAPPIVIYLS